MERGDKKNLLQKGIKSWGDKMGGIKQGGDILIGGTKKRMTPANPEVLKNCPTFGSSVSYVDPTLIKDDSRTEYL